MNAGLALADLDGDGDPDLIMANYMEPCQVWLNNGSGLFEDSGIRFGRGRNVPACASGRPGWGW